MKPYDISYTYPQLHLSINFTFLHYSQIVKFLLNLSVPLFHLYCPHDLAHEHRADELLHIFTVLCISVYR